MMICRWTTLMSQCPLENDHKRQQICQIRYEKCWVVCPVFQVYFTRHSHVTRAESQSNCSISQMCGPPGSHLMFIFPQMEPKTCGPPGFYFLKTGWTTRFFPCQICCLLCSILSGHCDVRVIHPHTIITSFVFYILDIITNKFTFLNWNWNMKQKI